MANEELIALLKQLQQPLTGSAGVPGLLSQLTALTGSVAGATTPSGENRAGAIGSAALGNLGSGLTLLPVVSGLLRLFGVGKQKEELPALEKFELPPAIRAEAGLGPTGETFLIDRGAGDRIRPLAPARDGGFRAGERAAERPAAGATSITVNVQAMDSQSFLDRREDIARAVREAMLESHSLNDVVSEL